MFLDLNPSQIIIVVVSLLVSLSFHEAMHAFAAHALGDHTASEEGRLTLNPLQHVDLLTTILLPLGLMLLHLPPFFIAKPVPFNPERVRWGEYGAALVALAGPFTNLALAVAASLFIRFAEPMPGTLTFTAGLLFMQVNIAFFVLNMVPFPPLDGSRLLYAFAPEPLQRVMERIESAGFTTILVFMLLLYPLIGGPISHINETIYTFLLR